MQGTIALQVKQKNGVVDQQKNILKGEHTRACCIINTIYPDDSHWGYKHPGGELDEDNKDPNVSPSKFQKLVDNRPRFVDVSDEMVRDVDSL